MIYKICCQAYKTHLDHVLLIKLDIKGHATLHWVFTCNTHFFFKSVKTYEIYKEDGKLRKKLKRQ